MSVCVDYQAVYQKRRPIVVSVRTQLFAAVVLLLALAFKVWLRIEATNVGYLIGKEKQVTIALDMERRELELQLSVLKRGDTLSRKAQVQLGLFPLKPRQARKIHY